MTPRTAADLRLLLGRPSVQVAPLLLGAMLRTSAASGVVTLRITEVEAYEGRRDPGSHAFRGMTRRNEVMFGEAGRLYVYRHLGLHHCANVVCSPAGTASAVLLRAGEVVSGRELALARRTARGVCRTAADLARGPARLTVALGLDAAANGADLCGGHGPVRLALAGPLPAERVSVGGRVGVSGAGGDPDQHPWRFWIAGDPTVSEYRRA